MSTLTLELRDRLRQELPGWLREDSEFRQRILNLTRNEFADRRETESRFDRVLNELRREVQVQVHKSEEQNCKCDERWAEKIAENYCLHEEIMVMADRLDRKVGAFGARWGLLSETAFRDGLAAILEKNFGSMYLTKLIS